MTQQDVYNLLKKKKEWMTVKEIYMILKISRTSVATSLNRLYKYKEVLRKKFKFKKSKGFKWRIGTI